MQLRKRKGVVACPLSMQSIKTIDCVACQPRRHSIFCDLSRKQLDTIQEHKVTKIYQKHEIIFHEGDKPQGLFCMFSGLVKIFKSSESGKDQIVRLSQTGDVLGYRSFFSGDLYAATAQAVNESMICYIEREGIEKMIHASPEVIYALLRKVCFELREAEEKFQDLLSKTVEDRLRHFLQFFFKNASSKKIELPLTRDEIASLMGARPETVIRVLSSWKEKQYLDIHAKSITLLDPAFLLS